MAKFLSIHYCAHLCPFWIQFPRLPCISKTLIILVEFGVSCGPVCVQDMIGWIKKYCLCVSLYRRRVILTVHSIAALSQLLQEQGLTVGGDSSWVHLYLDMARGGASGWLTGILRLEKKRAKSCKTTEINIWTLCTLTLQSIIV